MMMFVNEYIDLFFKSKKIKCANTLIPEHYLTYQFHITVLT